jgi:LPXTG-motif cell wall-anchored protein
VLGASLVAFGAAPASAATYPPTPPPSPGTGVLGTKTGVVSNSGLPHTGFDPSMLLIAGCALVLAGVAFLVILRLQIAASRR